jgi:hypothetical protein
MGSRTEMSDLAELRRTLVLDSSVSPPQLHHSMTVRVPRTIVRARQREDPFPPSPLTQRPARAETWALADHPSAHKHAQLLRGWHAGRPRGVAFQNAPSDTVLLDAEALEERVGAWKLQYQLQRPSGCQVGAGEDGTGQDSADGDPTETAMYCPGHDTHGVYFKDGSHRDMATAQG